ncbi:MAG: ATP-binding protein [Butyrivibrio sp.]|nr:ATP-binding protein [Butyrivibrio sp.]
MEKNVTKNEKANKKSEQIVLCVFTLFMISMFVSSFLLKWTLIEKEIIVVTVFAGWFVHIRKCWTHETRAKFLAVMTWVDFIVYAFRAESFTSLLATMSALVVLLGIFFIPRIVYMGVFFSTIIMLYHALIAHTIIIESFNDILRVGLHVISSYAVSAVTLFMILAQKETNEQLVENIRELEIAERSKDDFMVNISHEIRTPINAVCGMSEAILQEDLPINVRGDVIDIQTAGRNLLSAVSNILDFSELESGQMELAEESYNITSTITDIINMALTMENGKHLELVVDCDADLPSNLLGDEQKLRRIVLNLMSNAIKFTKEGGVVLRISSRKEEYGINLIVSIKDSGIGMELADMENIFASFSQVNSKRNREEGGVGLGLPIARALVMNMGGFITVDSTPGGGSEFQFTIPQKVLDETPIVSIKNKGQIRAICYINMDKYNFSIIREGYESCIRHIAEQLGIMLTACKNLMELKRRIERENFTHVFISWEEYCEDREFFEKLAKEITVTLILEYGRETQSGSNMLRIYKPFTILSIASVFNGQRVIQGTENKTAHEKRIIAPTAKVLIVDDNAMNLKVMARLLMPYQIKAYMASSGMEALNKLDEMEFDCVFLDHMMPEMDGVETLHKIRQKPGTYFQSLSVIAFTANAIGGAREMFISEGFNDFIAKPIELSVLDRMLRRYIPVQKQIVVTNEQSDNDAGSESRGAAPTSGMGKAVQDAAGTYTAEEAENKALDELAQAGVNVKQGITYCGDKEGFREIIGIFHKEGAKRRVSLEQYYKEHDWKNYVITAHTLKSNSKGIGADELSALAMNLEMAGKENRIDYILEHHDELLEAHDKLINILAGNSFIYPEGNDADAPNETVVGETAMGEGAADGIAAAETENGVAEEDAEAAKTVNKADKQSLSELVDALSNKLMSFESEGLSDILDKMAEYEHNGESLKGMTDKIRSLTDEFDFIGASEILDSWKETM